ncbi:MAG: D-aminoacyl-tRNA deacylase [Candidatus Nitrosotenuis sp.]
MELLVAYEKDPAGYNMAKFISKGLKKDGDLFRGKNFDLLIIPTPAISADWLEEKYIYDGFVFLSKHAAQSGELALTCHSTGNFADAQFGGRERQVAIPHPHLQKAYMKSLWQRKSDYAKFQIIIEATHHGPTALSKPTLFIEIGTTERQWVDENLCGSVASIILKTLSEPLEDSPVAICIGGTHYPEKFTKELIHGKYALGTVIPKHAIDLLDEDLFSHIMSRNRHATAALVDWAGLGKQKQKVLDLLKTTNLEVVRV